MTDEIETALERATERRVRHLQHVVADLVVRLSQHHQQVAVESAALNAERERLLIA